MDCDDVILLVAVGEGRTLSGTENLQLRQHVAGCEACRALTNETADEPPFRIARGVQGALDAQDTLDVLDGPGGPDGPDGIDLPAIDPSVFTKGDVLARGGMGRITRARDRRLGRDVAIKEVLAPELRARFEREVRITARLQHPAIVPIYEAGTWPDGSVFYTMRLVAGGTLADALDKATTLEARLALLPHVIALTEALGYAHAQRVVHRDLKPANVLVDEFGETVVIDWGLAKELERGPVTEPAREPAREPVTEPAREPVTEPAREPVTEPVTEPAREPVTEPARGSDRRAPEENTGDGAPGAPDLTHAGAVVGTPCFIAPEQAAGEDIDERADVYSLGAILYHLLAGAPPYWDSVEHTAARLIAAACQLPPTPIGKRAPRAPADLRAIVERAMARDKAARFPTAKEMAEELRRFETGQLLRSREYGMRELLWRRIRRHRAAATIGAVAVCVLAAGGALSVHRIVTSEHETRQALTRSQRANAEAQHANAATRRALAEARIERGRQLIVDGEPAQAAPYLAAALAELPTDPIALQLATIALRHAPRRLGSFEGTAAAFRSDGRELAIGRADGTIVVVDPATKQELRKLLPLGGEITALAYAPDGARLAVAAKHGAYLRDARTGAAMTITREESSEVRFLSGGDRLAVASTTTVSLVAPDDQRVITTVAVDRPHALAASRDGACLVALTGDRAIVWRAADLTRITEAGAGGDWRFSVAFGHGKVITAGMDGVHRWDTPQRDTTLWSQPVGSLSWIDDDTLLADGVVIQTATGVARPLGHASIQLGAVIATKPDIRPDTRPDTRPRRVITGGFDHTVRIWDVERTTQPIVMLDAADATGTLLVDPPGRRAISRGRRADARIELWDVSNLYAPARTANVEVQVDNLFTDDHDRIAVQVGRKTQLLTAALAPVGPSPPPTRPTLIDGWVLGFRPHHDELVTDLDGTLSIHASGDGTLRRKLRCPDKGQPSDGISHVAFSSTGAAMAISCDHSVWLGDADAPGDAGWRAVTRSKDSLGISGLALDDHDHVVTGHDDGTLKFWDAPPRATPDQAIDLGAAERRRPRVTVKGHAATLSALEIRGDTLISASWDRTLRLWAFPSGDPRGGVFKSFGNAAVSSNLQRFATVDGSASLSLWDGAQDRLLEQIPTADQLTHVAFLGDDRVVVGGVHGQLELIDLAEPLRTAEDVQRQVAALPRWQFVDGKLVERRAPEVGPASPPAP